MALVENGSMHGFSQQHKQLPGRSSKQSDSTYRENKAIDRLEQPLQLIIRCVEPAGEAQAVSAVALSWW
jgi:hypothetical protein